MIGALKGTIFSISEHSIILFTGGVGYTVFVTNRFLTHASKDSDAFLFIHSHIREDSFDLFGFPTPDELHIFELLLTVSGIGPKTALFVMNKGVESIKDAIYASDADFFATIPRLGKKNAQKIIIELKTKLGGSTGFHSSDSDNTKTQEILDALSSFGFKKQEILRAIHMIPDEAKTINEQITFCIKYLGKQ